MKQIKFIFLILGLGLIINLANIGLISNRTVSAGILGDQASQSAQVKDDEKSFEDLLKIAINTMLYVVGSLSIIMVIYGGIRYSASNGDPGKVAEAKKTISYALIGLVISLLAWTIINFVVIKMILGQ